MTSQPPEIFDPFDAEFRRDPYPMYARFRDAGPVHLGRAPMPSMPRCWYLFGHREVNGALHDPRFGRDRGGAVGGVNELPLASTVIRRVARRMVLFADPPRHGRLRGAMERAWSPDVSRRVTARTDELTRSFVAEIEGRTDLDLMQDLCIPLPVLVMAEALGIPERHRLRIKRWSTAIVALTDLHEDEGALEDAARATAEVVEYLRDLLAYRRRRPGDDLLSRLASLSGEEVTLTDDEILANAVLLLAAGHETTVGLLGNGLLALLERPEAAAALQARPALVPRAVEEMLRFDSPIQMTFRLVKEDLEIGGQRLERGDAAALVIGATNRDPAIFPDAERFIVERTPNPHLAFGGGPHVCYGAALARREARAVLNAILGVLPRLSVDGPIERAPNFLFRSLSALPVRLG